MRKVTNQSRSVSSAVTLMPDVALFGEDQGHETFLSALINRLSNEHNIPVNLKTYSSRGGLTRVHYEFNKFLSDVSKLRIQRPHLIVLATDSNCMGYLKRRQQMEEVANAFGDLREVVCYAIPDPHVERWMLVDSHAFKEAVGKGCQPLPKVKCAKDEYKKLLEDEIRKAGKTPLLGGFEYADDIVAQIDLARAEKTEASLEKTLKDLKGRFNQWKQ